MALKIRRHLFGKNINCYLLGMDRFFQYNLIIVFNADKDGKKNNVKDTFNHLIFLMVFSLCNMNASLFINFFFFNTIYRVVKII